MTQPIDILEEVLPFTCEGERLWGILSRPAPGGDEGAPGMLIIVGGPQYRVGSHRQFVQLARCVARAGYPVLRFDYRGMGDSEGALRDFEAAGPDVEAALQAFRRACPNMRRVVVWGLCDAASAALMFTTNDPDVAGIVAVNPWARSEATLASTQLRHYYLARLTQREFWAKLLRCDLQWRRAWESFSASVRTAATRPAAGSPGGSSGAPFQDRMAQGLARFRGRVLLIISGNDLTAKEFLHCAGTRDSWRGLLADPKVTRSDLPEADHTFSRRAWLDDVEAQTVAWLAGLAGGSPTRPTAGRP